MRWCWVALFLRFIVIEPVGAMWLSAWLGVAVLGLCIRIHGRRFK